MRGDDSRKIVINTMTIFSVRAGPTVALLRDFESSRNCAVATCVATLGVSAKAETRSPSKSTGK